MIREIIYAIWQHFLSHTESGGLYDLLSGRLYFGEAPESAVMPYGVFYGISETADGFYSGIDADLRLQLSLFSNEKGAEEVLKLQDAAISLFDGARLPLPAWAASRFIAVAYVSSIPPQRVEDAWQAVLEFSVRYDLPAG